MKIGQIIEYLPIQLDNQEDNFLVDGRYKIREYGYVVPYYYHVV